MSREELLVWAARYRMTADMLHTMCVRLSDTLPHDMPVEELLRTPTVVVPTDLVRQCRNFLSQHREMNRGLMALTIEHASYKAPSQPYQ